MRKGRRPLGLFLLLAFVATACGSRASDEQKLQARGRAAAVADGSTSAGGATAADGSTTATVDGGAGTDSGRGGIDQASGATGSATGTGGGGTGDGVTRETVPSAPAGGNGGATDVGVTGDTIVLGNVSTLSGPIPGLFQGAVTGAQAFVAYVNSLGGVYGRKLKLEVRDDQFDAGQHGAQTADLSKKALAFLGSFSTYDDTGSPHVQRAGMADVGYGLTETRRNLAQNFSPQPGKSRHFRTGNFISYAKKHPDAVKFAGTIYGDIPASKESALDAVAAAESVGWRFVYQRAYQPTEADFTADVVRMRQDGVRAVYVVGADVKTMARLLKAMQQQRFEPDLVALGASGYDATLVPLAGSAAEGVWIDQQLALYQGGDAATIPEVALLNEWVGKVRPGAKPDLFATYSWASGRILLQALQAAGPRLTRQALLGALRRIDQFDANGLVAPAGPASKRPPTCDMFLRVQGGRFVRVEPAGKGFVCGGRMHRRP